MLPLEASGSGPLGPLLPHDLTEFFVGIVLFGLILLIIGKVVSPKFEAMYTQRRAEIEDRMVSAAHAEAKANETLAQYQAKIATVEDEAATIREGARTEGAQILSEMRAKATTEAERIVSQAELQVEASRAQAAEQLRTQVGGLATALAGKIVGENLDDERAARTVDRFLADLEAERA